MKTVRTNYATNEEWLQDRHKGIGASEIAAIVGLNPYATPYDIWRQKLELDPPKEETLPIKLGHLLEDSVATLFAEETAAVIDPDTKGDFTCYLDEKPFLRASPDRYYTDRNGQTCLLECKTTQKTIDSDDIPEMWFAQLQYQMGITGIEHGAVAWLSQGRTFGFAEFDFVPDFFDFLAGEAEKFWTVNVAGRQEPELLGSEDILLKFGLGDKDKVATASEEVYESYCKLKDIKREIQELEEEKKGLEETLKLSLMDASVLDYNGKTIATWKASKPSQTFNASAFEKDHPDMYKAYLTEKAGTRRFLVK